MANLATIGSLFKKTKNDPEFAESQQRARQSLLRTLSRAIKEVQLLSTECGESGRVGDCQATQRLCTGFENSLRHGLKGRWFGQSGSFWRLVLQISRKQAVEYISGLQHAVSEMGKCRAWIRLAVNESSLESYVGVICQDSSLRSQYYEAHAFVRDEDVVGPLQQLLAGLSQINFNITVDTASLEYEAVPEALQPPLQLRLPRHLMDSGVHRKKRSHRKVKSSSVRSHDRQVTPIEDSSDESLSSDAEDTEEIVVAMRIEKRENLRSRVIVGGEVDTGGGGREGAGVIGELGAGVIGELGDGVIGELGAGVIGELGDGVIGELGDGVSGDMRENVERMETGEMVTAVEGGRGVIGDRWEVGDGSGEIVDSGEGVREGIGGGGDGGMEKNESLFLSVEDGGSPVQDGSIQDNLQDNVQDNIQDNLHDNVQDNIQDSLQDNVQDNIQDSLQDNVQDNLQGSIQDNVQDSYKDTPYSGVLQIDSFGSHDDDHGKGEKEREKGDGEMVRGQEPTALSLEQEFESLELRQSTSPDSRPLVVDPDQLGMGSPLQLQTPFDRDCPDSVPNRASTNLFDKLEQDLGSDQGGHTHQGDHDHHEDHTHQGDHTHSSREEEEHGERGQNPFDSPSSPPHMVTPTTDPAHPATQPQTTTTNPFDSAPATPSLPTSPTSSDFLSGEAPQSAARYEEGELRASRADSLEWSLYLEQNMIDLPGGVASSELALEEDHYSAELGRAELQEAILRLKKKIVSSSSSSSPAEQHLLRRRIVQLQLKLQTLKEEEESQVPYEEVCGHKFVWQPRQRKVLRDLHCLTCKKRVRGLIREWYRCKTCQSVCHKKCLSSVVSQCSIPAEDTEYILEVCPEVGLTAQQFRCVRCNRQLTQTPPVEVRLCDYDGLYYCPECHSNDLAVIPARVMHNWDFVARPVCCQCSSLLRHLSSRPLLRVQKVNPLLYTHIQDLVEVEGLRRDLLQMKTYLTSCQTALDQKLLHRLDVFPNFKEDVSLLTLHEMVEIQNGSLLPALKDIHSRFTQHIKSNCQTCSRRGQLCLLCSSGQPLFPFGHDISLCPHCSSPFHKDCFSEISACPKCHETKT